MYLRSYLTVAALVLFMSVAYGKTEEGEYWKGRLFVKISETSHVRLPLFGKHNPEKAKQDPVIGRLVGKYKINALEKPFGRMAKLAYFDNVYEVKFDEGVPESELMRAIAAHPAVEFVERIPVERTLLTPNDPAISAGELWHLGKIDAYQAWDIATGLPDITIAIVDDAVKITHEDLNASLWVNPGEIPGNGIDDDGNGKVDDIHGYDLADNDNDPNPPSWATSASFSHGTHTAGIAAAATNNGLGVASVSYGVKVMAVKCTQDATTNTNIIQYGWQGLQYAIESGADIISLSWGGTGSSSIYQNIINAARAEGVIIVASAGNAGSTTPFYPAAYDNVIAVAASTPNDLKASYSNYGSWISLTAPGSQMKSCVATNNSSYGYKSGTSMAAPLVASACGLILSYNPTLSPDEVEAALYSSADNIDALNPSYVNMMGAGRLNVYSALQQVQAVGCIPPFNINAAPVSNNSALLNWAGIGADSYSVKIREAGGAWQTYSTGANTYNLSQLEPCTEYEVQIRSVCGGSPSDYSASYFFTTLSAQTLSYCAASGIASNLEWVAGVAVGGINSMSDSDGGYVERACDIAVLNAGDSYAITLTPGFIGPAYTEYWRVWVDYNMDGDFDDANELVFDAGGTSTAAVSGNFTVPEGTAAGATRMRVAMKWVGVGDTNPPFACSTFNYGEVEDYGVYLNGTPSEPPVTTCNIPQGVGVATSGTNSISLSWLAVGGSTGYEVQYRLLGATSWLAEEVASTFATIGGLQASTNYEFRVKTICGVGAESGFSGTVSAATLPEPCNTPDGLSVGNISNSGATLSWLNATGALSYNLRYRKLGTSGWAMETATSNFRTLIGLESFTSYEFQVQSVCSGGLSDFSGSYTFQTSAAPCSVPTGLATSGVTSGGAALSWSAVGGATHTIRYREVGILTWQSTSPISGGGASLTGLVPATNYEAQIRANCSSGISAYSSSVYFTTSEAACQAPVGLTATGIDEASIQATWSAVPGADAYLVSYRQAGAAAWSVESTFGNTVTIDGLAAATVYEIKVKSDCGSGNQSVFGATVTASTGSAPICGVPTNLAAGNITVSSALLSWDHVASSVSYMVLYRAADASGGWITLTAFSNELAVSGLLASTAYQFMVRTQCAGGDASGFSPITSFTTEGLVCQTPTNVSISGVGTGSATVSWTAVGGVNYTLRYRPVSGAWQSILVAGNSATIEGLLEGTGYEVEVRSNCAFGSSTYSGTVSFMTEGNVCAVPVGLSVLSASETSVLLVWSFVSGADAYVVSYRVAGTGLWMTASSFSAFASINGLLPGTTYEFRVKADCGGGDQSAYSESVTAATDESACEAPATLWVSNLSDTQAQLNWSGVGGAMSYAVEYRKSGVFTWTTLTITSSFVTITGLEPESGYQFRVRTLCAGGGQSAYSLLQVFTTESPAICPAPAGLAVASVTSGTALLGWTPAMGASSYTLHYRAAGSLSWTSINSISGSSYMLVGLEPGIGYEAKMNAVCAFGASDYSDTVSFTTDQVGCSTPVGLNVTGLAETQATLNWEAVPGASLYNVRFRVAGSLWWTTLSSINASKLLTGLSAATVYEFQVRTKCGTSVASSYSPTMVFVTPATESCAMPSAVLVTGIDTDNATVYWNNIPGATGYLLRYKLSTSGSTGWTTLLTGYTNSFSITGLTPGFSYDVQVRALCGSIGSPFSNTVSFTTLDDGCGTPSNMYAMDIMPNQAMVGFDLVSGAIYYNIQYRAVGATAWVTSGTFTSSKLLVGLLPSTAYEFRVRAYCSDSFSDFSNIQVFSTAADPATVEVNEANSCTLKAMFNYIVEGRSVSFENTSNGGDTYLWYFGDGTLAEMENPEHRFAREGVYSFTFIVSDSETGCASMFEGDLSIY